MLIPFIIKSLQPGLEIYPAIIFPAGAEKLNLNAEIRSFQNYELYGFKDTLIQIDTKKFLDEIPRQYYHSLVKGSFGLENYLNEFILPYTPFRFSEKNYLNDKKIKEAKIWIRDKLTRQGVSDSILIVRKIQNDYDINERKLKNQRIIDEKTFSLY